MDGFKKQVVQQFFDAVAAGDAARLRSLVTDDFTHRFLGTTALAGTRNFAELSAMQTAFSAALAGPGAFTIDEIAEEGNLVLAVLSGSFALKNGKRYDGDYVASIGFRGDHILYMHELGDTKLADDVFG
ncbi:MULTISPECIES: nuclear transport factor 2 family protein [Sphingobium]|uniref:nuclear transport factor 2 family protein n=1 Tax=Sphingobium TaxID=165695 RepID=UPI00159BF0BC|nr:nuclear transport factor 2 family protein [Sphingobium sp. 15-1]